METITFDPKDKLGKRNILLDERNLTVEEPKSGVFSLSACADEQNGFYREFSLSQFILTSAVCDIYSYLLNSFSHYN